MTASADTLRSGIDDDLVWSGRSPGHDVNAPRYERPRSQPALRLLLDGFDCCFAQQPNCLFGELSVRLRALAPENGGSDSKRIGHVLGLVAARVEDPAPVVITKTSGRTSLGEGLDDGEHSLQGLIEGDRNGHAVPRGQDARVQKKIESVDVIMQGLFEINAVGTDLSLGRLQDHAPAAIFPVPGAWPLRP